MARNSMFAYESEKSVFATRLREVMRERNESQSSLTEKISKYIPLQRQTLSLYMNGQSKPDTERLTAICKALSVSADYLLGMHDVKSINLEIEDIAHKTGLYEDTVKCLISCKPIIMEGADNLQIDTLHEFQGPYFDDCHNAIDALLSVNESNTLFTNLLNIYDLVGSISECIEEYKSDYNSNPDDCSYEDALKRLKGIHKDLRLTVFELSESIIGIADSLYSYKQALSDCEDCINVINDRIKEAES